MRLQDKVAVITGAASGIGRSTALTFAANGARVAVADIADGNGTVKEICDSGGEAVYVPTDVTEAAAVDALIRAAIAEWGQLDIIFNNAGVSFPGRVDTATPEDFDRVFNINVKGVFLGCRYALPHFLEKGSGVIVNMSSNAGLVGRANDPIYSASKHAVLGLTKSIAVTYAHRNIRANALCPGPIDTPMLRTAGGPPEQFEERLPRILCSCPAARCGTADEVAHAALFLASDESRFVTGIALPVDGGKAAGIMPNDRYRMDFSLSA